VAEADCDAHAGVPPCENPDYHRPNWKPAEVAAEPLFSCCSMEPERMQTDAVPTWRLNAATEEAPAACPKKNLHAEVAEPNV